MSKNVPRTIEDVVGKGSRVFLRCDFNVPLDAWGAIVDDFRIRAALPTIRELLDRGAFVVIGTHLGDPKGRYDAALSARVVSKRLEELLMRPVAFVSSLERSGIIKATRSLKSGNVAVLENLRFHPGEEANDASFARSLSACADCYVNEAFSVSHRVHASITLLPMLLPSALGSLFIREMHVLSALLDNPARPVVAIVGGVKIQSKLGVVERLLELADSVILGNVLAKDAREKGIVFARSEKLILPLDGFPSNEDALDIGVETRKKFCDIIRGAKTIFWAGPLGKVEEDLYAKGSLETARCVASSGALSIIGGGDLGAFIHAHSLEHLFSHISTGGGAMLEYISTGDLPGLRAMREGARS